MGTGWSHTHLWWIKIRRNTSAAEVPSEDWRVPTPQQALQSRVLSVKTSQNWGWERQRASGVPSSSSQRVGTWTYLDSLPLSSSAGVADWKEPGWWFRGRDSFLPERNAGRGHCCFSETPAPHSTESAGRCYIWVSIRWAYTLDPTLVVPWDSVLPDLWAHPSCFQWLFHLNGLVHASSWGCQKGRERARNLKNYLKK